MSEARGSGGGPKQVSHCFGEGCALPGGADLKLIPSTSVGAFGSDCRVTVVLGTADCGARFGKCQVLLGALASLGPCGSGTNAWLE